MLLSSLGDIVLMDYKPLTNKLPLKGFTVGSALFALAHALYASAYTVKYLSESSFKINPGSYIATGLFIISVLILTLLMIRNNNKSVKMYVLGLVYLILISSNCFAIFTFGIGNIPKGIVPVIGASSFFFSDFIIALDKIGGIKVKNMTDIIWWFYPIGQILILIGAAL